MPGAVTLGLGTLSPALLPPLAKCRWATPSLFLPCTRKGHATSVRLHSVANGCAAGRLQARRRAYPRASYASMCRLKKPAAVWIIFTSASPAVLPSSWTKRTEPSTSPPERMGAHTMARYCSLSRQIATWL